MFSFSNGWDQSENGQWWSERRVKNIVTNMKGYIVMLALCVYVCVCVSFINWSFVLSPGLQLCDIYIMQVTVKVRYK